MDALLCPMNSAESPLFSQKSNMTQLGGVIYVGQMGVLFASLFLFFGWHFCFRVGTLVFSSDTPFSSSSILFLINPLTHSHALTPNLPAFQHPNLIKHRSQNPSLQQHHLRAHSSLAYPHGVRLAPWGCQFGVYG